MPQIKYNIIPVDPIGLDKISSDDSAIIEQFSINNLIDLKKDNIELHIQLNFFAKTMSDLFVRSFFDYMILIK